MLIFEGLRKLSVRIIFKPKGPDSLRVSSKERWQMPWKPMEQEAAEGKQTNKQTLKRKPKASEKFIG